MGITYGDNHYTKTYRVVKFCSPTHVILSDKGMEIPNTQCCVVTFDPYFKWKDESESFLPDVQILFEDGSTQYGNDFKARLDKDDSDLFIDFLNNDDFVELNNYG